MYLGHSPTNAGSFIFLDDIASGFNGSETQFTLQVGGVNITPNTQNLLIALDGIIQQAPDAYTTSGSTITFTGAVPSGTDFYGILMGQSASIGQGTIGADELKISGNGTSGQLVKSDGDGSYSYLSTTDITSVGTLSSLTLGGDLLVPQYIKHVGDTDCHIEFDTDQIKLRTGNSSRLIARDSDVELYSPLVATSATFSGSVTIPEFIYHSGDTDTFIRFTDNKINFVSGNSTALELGGTVSGNTIRGNSTFTGNITLNTSSHSTLLIKGADGCDAELALQSDNADDATDKWSINAKHSTGGTLHFATYGSGSWTNPLILSHTEATFSGSIKGKTDAHLSYTTGQAIDTVSGGAFLAEGSDVIAGRFFFQGYNADGGKLVGFNNESDQLVMYNYGDGNYMSKIKYNGDVDFIRNFHGGANRVTNPWDASGSTNYGSLYFQKGSASLGQTFATATNVAVGGGYANWYSNIIDASSTSHRHVQWMNDGTSAGTITYNSSNSVAYNTSGSDKSLKKNFANWTENVLDNFDKINPQLFHFKTQNGKEDKHKGFIAQDMLDKFPEAYPLVTYGEGDSQTEKYQFNPSGMVVYLMKAVQELSAEIKLLKGN